MCSPEVMLGATGPVTLAGALAQHNAEVLADSYGLPSRVQTGNTSARRPGVRAAVETAWGLQMGIAAGANLVNTGLLDSTLMLSLEHLVLVDELVSRLQVRASSRIGRTPPCFPSPESISIGRGPPMRSSRWWP